MRAKELERFKKLLLSQKAELLNNTRKLLKEEAQHSPDDLADETDLASSEVNQSLTLRLRDRERLLIQIASPRPACYRWSHYQQQ